MSQQDSLSEPEILRLTQVALELANLAVHYDTMQQTVVACDYYDKCILHLDEVLNKLPMGSREWNALMQLRGKYDDRMETLRDMENSKFDIGGLVGGDGKKINKTPKRRKQSLVLFEEDEQLTTLDQSQTNKLLEPPTSIIQLPYWQMKVVQRTILNGGFLTPTLFVPKNVWNQYGVKFSGIVAKSSAFKDMINLISTHIEHITLENSEESFENAAMVLKGLLEEFISLQNQLSKSFPFIREVIVPQEEPPNSPSTKGQVRILCILYKPV